MKKILMILLPISLFVFSCEDKNESDELPYKDLYWIQFKWCCYQGSGDTTLYYLNSSPSLPNYDNKWSSKYIHYYEDEGYFEYERTGETIVKSKDISPLSTEYYDIQYLEK